MIGIKKHKYCFQYFFILKIYNMKTKSNNSKIILEGLLPTAKVKNKPIKNIFLLVKLFTSNKHKYIATNWQNIEVNTAIEWTVIEIYVKGIPLHKDKTIKVITLKYLLISAKRMDMRKN